MTAVRRSGWFQWGSPSRHELVLLARAAELGDDETEEASPVLDGIRETVQSFLAAGYPAGTAVGVALRSSVAACDEDPGRQRLLTVTARDS